MWCHFSGGRVWRWRSVDWYMRQRGQMACALGVEKLAWSSLGSQSWFAVGTNFGYRKVVAGHARCVDVCLVI